MASSFDKLKDLNLSRDEVSRLGEALRKEEFRKLLVEYVEELQDPENRKIYEQEIKELERERGNDVTFLHPTPSYVIKSSINGTQKCFINICVNDIVGKPTSSVTVKDGARGLQWQLPHSLAPPREDIDNRKIRCKVFDVIFHPDTLHLASKNNSFRDIVNTTALEAVENNFNVVIDKKNLKFPKLNYKGIAKPCVIRKPTADPLPERTAEEKAVYDKIFAQADATVNNSYKNSPKKVKKQRRNSNEDNSAYTTPTYTIKHRSHVDIQEFTEHKEAKLNTTIPKELVIEINLPLLKSSSDMNLDVTEKTVQLLTEKPAKYKLNLTLPYSVNEASGSAKFDKDLKNLVIVLPVKRTSISEYNREDSGVESDGNGPVSPDNNSDVKELISEIVAEENSEISLENPVVFRTKFEESFLDSSLHYSLPEFTCNVFENTVAFTLNVKNVDENTIVKKVSNNLVWLKFTSVSSSFYPSHYAFLVKFPSHNCEEENVCTEAWDNNVILQIPLIHSNIEFTTYFFGVDENSLNEKYIEEPTVINKVLSGAENDAKKCETHLESENVEETKKEMIQPNINKIPLNNIEGKHDITPHSEKHQSKAMDILATSYESSEDEISCGSFSPRKHGRGILKRMSSSRSSIGIGRSISESSLDDFVCSSFENCPMSLDSDIPEDSEMSTSLKKTVRFSDVVMKQLFRSNSSILGQKKKNQRKAKNKKRAHDRRHSESEASDVETRREGDLKTGNANTSENNEDMATADDKKYEHGIFDLEINN